VVAAENGFVSAGVEQVVEEVPLDSGEVSVDTTADIRGLPP